MGSRILIADKIHGRAGAVLQEAGFDVERRAKITEEELLATIGAFEGVLVRSRICIQRRHIEAGTRLKVIGRAGAGVDNIDVSAATKHGVAVVNAPGSNADSVAEHVFALLLNACRHVGRAGQVMREGGWDRHAFVGSEIGGKTIGIVGLGRIGRRVAEIARGFGMRVLANSPGTMRDPDRRALMEERGIRLVDLLDLLREADVVTLHCPLNEVTTHLIGARELEAMKPTAVLVNTARGPLVDEAALLEALAAGRIRAACLDVFHEEPPPKDWPLRSLPNVVLTPHLGASTEEAQVRAAEWIARGIIEFLRTGRTTNMVNPEVAGSA